MRVSCASTAGCRRRNRLALLCPSIFMDAARHVVGRGHLSLGVDFGFRNGQSDGVLAPTGTIAFLMDCDTTGIEPDIALVKYKRLVGGGMLKIVNHTVPEALAQARLRRQSSRRRSARTSIDKSETIEGAPGSER